MFEETQTWTPIFFAASKHGHPQITVLIHLLLCPIITLELKDLPKEARHAKTPKTMHFISKYPLLPLHFPLRA
jgi:hypothetical protein